MRVDDETSVGADLVRLFSGLRQEVMKFCYLFLVFSVSFAVVVVVVRRWRRRRLPRSLLIVWECSMIYICF